MNSYKPTRRQFLTTMACAGAYGLVGPLRSWAGAPVGQKLMVRVDRDIQVLDPASMVGGVDIEVQFAVLPRLVEYVYQNNQYSVVPGPIVERIVQRDPVRYDFTLKEGFKWSNDFGDVTAEDVKYSYERMVKSTYKGYFDQFERVEVKDKLNGTVVLKWPFAPFWLATAAHGTGSILSAKATEKAGGKFTTEIPATCGPYQYQWTPKQKIVFTPNPAWPGPKPSFPEVQALLVEQAKAADLAYEAGELDCTEISSAAHARYLKKLPAHSLLYKASSLRYMWLGMNTQHPKLKDIRVRQAIQNAIDVNSIAQGAYSGTVEIAYGPICPGQIGRRTKPEQRGYSYNPGKAKQLVSEAGATGLELDLITLNEQERVLAAQIVQSNLQAVGIKCKVLPVDSGPFWSLGQEKKGEAWKDSQLWLRRDGTNPDPYGVMQWFRREQIGKWNWERWSNDEFETLYDKGLAETDPAKREGIYLRMQDIMDATGAYVWICNETETWIHKATLTPKSSPKGEMIYSGFKPS
ncbi:MAG: ABC transporter substrate-binding protein [Thermodesulfobacteriota bacterium]